MQMEKPLPNNSVKSMIGVFANTILADIHMSKYEVQKICGIGSNGCVFVVEDKHDNQLYAMKCVNLSYYITKRFHLNLSEIHSEIYIMFDELSERIMGSKYQIADYPQKIVSNFDSMAEKNSFFREFEALKRLPHTYKTVYLVDYGYFNIKSDGEINFQCKIPYIIMPLMSGTPLTCYIESTISPSKRLKTVLLWTEEIIDIVSLIHDKRVIHRDLYSNNFLFDPNSGHVNLIDFGAALTLGHEELDTPGERRGARRFMSPEQFRDPRNVDFRSDYFFIGALMFYGLTTKTPFERSREVSTLPQSFKKAYKNELFLSMDAVSSLDIFISTISEYAPGKRFQTIGEIQRSFCYVKTILERELSTYE